MGGLGEDRSGDFRLTPLDVEARLVAQVRAPAALRRVLARVAGRMVAVRGWERLGFARLADYAVERAGVSARELRELARVDGALRGLPGLEAAFLSGRLGWAKLRLLCRVARAGDEGRWLALARCTTVRALEREVRAVDRRAREAGVAPALAPEEAEGDDGDRVGVTLRCTGPVRARWWRARQVASRVAGQRLSHGAFAEVLAAEVLSAVGLEGGVPEAPEGGKAARSEPGAREPEPAPPGVAASEAAARCAPPAAPRFVAALERGLEEADAFELDARLRRALRLEAQGLARVASGLAAVAACGLHRSLGFRSLDAYAQERLGMAPSRARALLRIARAAERCPALRLAFATGRLSWVQAHALVPLLLEVEAAPQGPAWVEHAARVSVRRLADDVEAALATGALAPPPLAAPDADADACRGEGPAGLQTGAAARSPRERVRLVFGAPGEVAQLFRAVLATVQRRIEREHGRHSSESEALGAMLDHALAVWEAGGEAGDGRRRLPREHRVFARDGWRCTVPGCSSYRNLHGHHVVFRARGGADDLANLTTLCAWHHLRGVHAGLVGVTGAAPGALRFELGVRPGAPALAVYGSGDVRV